MTRTMAVITFVFALMAPGGASAQLHRSLCADCHFANGGGPDPRHLTEWETSAHARADVGCEACHGGNPGTVENSLAHRTMVRGRGPESPLHPTNLPRTCGRCHAGPYVEFQKSRHDALLRGGASDGPTCSTCHGNTATYLLGPKALESQCNSCHGAGRKAPRAEYASNARVLLSGVRDVRALLNTAKPLIRHVKDTAARDALQYAYDQAVVPLTEAVEGGHAFVFDNAEQRLAVARMRAEALLERLANR